ncbi:hypothetical protein HanIR_Chr15g0759421 [Helianthus annuus]|nr:hypothetical protein HanIR_Chr15g0759421 [Helianthus annuus]
MGVFIGLLVLMIRLGLIVSFDLTSEEFREVNLPSSLAHSCCNLLVDKLRESLAVIEPNIEANKLVYHVWMMEYGVPRSFEKLYTISSHLPCVSIVCICGFRKTGEPLIELHTHPGSLNCILAAYDPYSKFISNVGIIGRYRSFFVYTYMETLLLL